MSSQLDSAFENSATTTRYKCEKTTSTKSRPRRAAELLRFFFSASSSLKQNKKNIFSHFSFGRARRASVCHSVFMCVCVSMCLWWFSERAEEETRRVCSSARARVSNSVCLEFESDSDSECRISIIFIIIIWTLLLLLLLLLQLVLRVSIRWRLMITEWWQLGKKIILEDDDCHHQYYGNSRESPSSPQPPLHLIISRVYSPHFLPPLPLTRVFVRVRALCCRRRQRHCRRRLTLEVHITFYILLIHKKSRVVFRVL